jgi:hypothetical protein
VPKAASASSEKKRCERRSTRTNRCQVSASVPVMLRLTVEWFSSSRVVRYAEVVAIGTGEGEDRSGNP